MLRALVTVLFLFQPLAAAALCEGRDLIDALPAEERAALQAQVDATAYPDGLLWRATRDDGTQITLFGTYHFRHQMTDAHLERLKRLIEAADRVYLEISNADQLEMQRAMAEDPSIMFITEGPTLPDLLGDEDWAHFSDEMRARNIPAFMAAKFKPLWATMMLGIGPCEARSGALEGNGIDHMVGDYAAEIGNPSHSLEDFEVLMGLLDKEPLDKQLNMIRLTLAWPGNADDLSYTIRQQYLAEEIALTWAFSRLISLKYGGPTAEEDFEQITETLLEKRNADWIARLMQEAAGQTVFIAAGAGHLPGKIGVLRLLEREGFAVERLPL